MRALDVLGLPKFEISDLEKVQETWLWVMDWDNITITLIFVDLLVF